MWKTYALLSAVFASLTAIFAKIGVRDVNADIATAIRVTIILVMTWCIALFGHGIKEIRAVDCRSLLFLVLSALATGASWLFYFRALQCGEASRVAPIDKLSVAITIFLSIVLLGEPAEPKTIIGGMLIVGGSLVLLL